MTIIELLEQAKTRANIPSDYALAKVLGIERNIISGWRKNKRHPSDEDAVKLATLAGLDEMQVIAQIHYETATNEKKKEFWGQFLERRGITATLGLIGLGLSIVVTPEPAQAGVLQLQNYGELSRQTIDSNIHYANIGQGEPGTVRGTVSPEKPDFTFHQLAATLPARSAGRSKVAVSVPLQLIPISGSPCYDIQTIFKPYGSWLPARLGVSQNYSTFDTQSEPVAHLPEHSLEAAIFSACPFCLRRLP